MPPSSQVHEANQRVGWARSSVTTEQAKLTGMRHQLAELQRAIEAQELHVAQAERTLADAREYLAHWEKANTHEARLEAARKRQAAAIQAAQEQAAQAEAAIAVAQAEKLRAAEVLAAVLEGAD
jgi:hypothetical protein